MPRLTVLNLRRHDSLAQIGEALKSALVSRAEMAVRLDDVDFVPVIAPEGFDAKVARIDVDLWIAPHRNKELLQDVALRMASAFQRVVGSDRRVKVVLKPYDLGAVGWVSLQ